MNSATQQHSKPGINWRAQAYEALNELRRSARMPMFVLPSLLFPWMFYTFFGVLFNKGGGHAAYLMVSYACFGVIGPALFGFGVSVSVDRQQGLLSLKRAVAMPVSAYFNAKIIMSLIFGLIIIHGLLVIALTMTDLSISFGQWIALATVLLLGALPFCALGLAIGIWVNAQAAPAVINLVYLPSAFLSGLWIPIFLLPQSLQQVAWILPPYHFSQLCYGVLGISQGYPMTIHLFALLAFTVLFLALAKKGYQRISDR
ncbi:MAG: ABC transporter permease [Xanthomonadales bacterium]|nr:ABC transporter permease [Xanthomonadales bacterium]